MLFYGRYQSLFVNTASFTTIEKVIFLVCDHSVFIIYESYSGQIQFSVVNKSFGKHVELVETFKERIASGSFADIGSKDVDIYLK